MNEAPLRDRLAVVVHEVRSPVAALVAIGEAFAGSGLDRAERRELAGLATAACRGIERIVRDATLASVRREDVDLGRLVHEAAGAASLSGVRVHVRVAPGLPRLTADPLRLRQALDNLLSNALVHTPRDTEVTVGASAEGGQILLFVSDAGPGIPLTDQDRIFEAGARLDMRRAGSGLGLWIARTIAEAHGGTLTVKSPPGKGATFTIALPEQLEE